MRPVIPRRTVLTYGSFDMLGPDEAAFLKRLCCMGTELIVGCTTDEFAEARGTSCRVRFERRREALQACRFVSRVIPENSWNQKRTDIVNYNVAIFAMSEDWSGTFDDLGHLAEVVYLPNQRRDPSHQMERSDRLGFRIGGN